MDKPLTKSELAMAAAMQAIAPCNPKTAALLMFFAATRNLVQSLDDRERASLIVYQAADAIVAGDEP